MKKVFILVLLLFNLVILLANNKLDKLANEDWEYKWGDSPIIQNIPIWILNSEENKWEKISYPRNPSFRNNQNNAWFRIKLPNSKIKNPHIYIYSIDFNSEVYFKGNKIYSFGEINDSGVGSYIGWPCHIFKLPADYQNNYLYFRVYSNYIDIGLFGEILLGSKGDILEHILFYDIRKMVVGSICIFVAVIFLLSFLSKFIKVELFILGSLFLTQGLNLLSSVKIFQLYFNYPLLTQYILVITFFYFPIGIALFMDKAIKLKVPFNFIKRIWQIHLLYLIVSISGTLFGFFTIPSIYVYFDKLYYFLTLPILSLYMMYFFFKGNKEVKLITASFLIVSIYWVYSFLVAYSYVPWTEYPSDIAIFVCLLLLSYSIIKKLNYTSELEEEKEELQIISSTDHLTKLLNRKELDKLLLDSKNFYDEYNEEFSIILIDIDNFKQVNDIYGHITGDKVLIKIANILSTHTRECDIVGRWGGEEFLIICPKTSSSQSSHLAEHLRYEIENFKFNRIGNKTISAGVTSFLKNDTVNRLLKRVDEALYKSKKEGKNKVTVL